MQGALLSSGFSTRDQNQIPSLPNTEWPEPTPGLFPGGPFFSKKGISHFSRGADILLPRPLTKSRHRFLRTEVGVGDAHSRLEA